MGKLQLNKLPISRNGQFLGLGVTYTHKCAMNIVEKYEVAWQWGSRDMHVQTRCIRQTTLKAKNSLQLATWCTVVYLHARYM